MLTRSKCAGVKKICRAKHMLQLNLVTSTFGKTTSYIAIRIAIVLQYIAASI